MVFGKTINKYYLKYLHLILLGVFFIVVVDYFQLEIPELMRDAIDGLNNGTLTKDALVDLLLITASYAGIIIIGRFLWRVTLLRASRLVTYDMRNEMFAHLEKLDQGFYNRSKSGGLMALFTNDMNQIRMSVGFGAVMIADTLFLGSLAFYKMYSINVTLSILSTIPLVILAIVGGFIAKKIQTTFHDRQQAFEDMSDFVNENMSGIHVIKAFVKEGFQQKRFLEHNLDNQVKTVRFVKFVALIDVLIRFVVFSVVVIILLYGGSLLLTTAGTADPFTYGELFEYIQYFFAMIWPMIAVVRVIQMASSAKASLNRINEVLDEEIVIKDENVERHDILGGIKFSNVNFKYPDSEVDQLKNISFEINAGETVGIIGRTGSGKTTLVDLLLRIYNIEEGIIALDGHNIMNLPLFDVRQAVGYVPQDGFLFSDTLANNISLGINNNETNIDVIMSAAKNAVVHDNISDFTDGYETVIGERGVTLSGGQKQRVSIARAIIKDPAILILDDSVSAVDTKTETEILGNLKEIRDGKTTIIIAHRITSIQNAEKIILVENGEIDGVGTHDELFENNAIYRDIVIRQKLENEIEAI